MTARSRPRPFAASSSSGYGSGGHLLAALLTLTLSACGAQEADTAPAPAPPTEQPPQASAPSAGPATACEQEAWRPITLRELVESDDSEGAPDIDAAADEAMDAAGYGVREVAYINWVGTAGLVAVRSGDLVVLQADHGAPLSVSGHLTLPGVGDTSEVEVSEVAAADRVGAPGHEMWIAYSVDQTKAVAIVSLSPLEVIAHAAPVCEMTLSVADRDCDGQREVQIDPGC